MAYRKRLELDLGRVLIFPEIHPDEMKQFREKYYISKADIEKYLGITMKTTGKIEDGYSVSKSIENLYSLGLERIMMLSKGYVPAYRKIGTNEYVDLNNVRSITNGQC